MELKTILSVSGKPGLFKLVSNAKNMVIVESLSDKRRLPIYARDKVVSLGDIAMYTETDEVPLQEILLTIQNKENGQKISIAPNSKPDELRKYFGEILPDYDRDRVYDTDIKKLISWYNLLIEAGFTFEKEEESEEQSEAESAEQEAEEEAVEPVVEEEKKKSPKKTSKPKKEKE